MTATGRIGRYRLLDVSGTGTFATVHRAEDERLGDTVAIKVLAENHSLDPDVRERFLQEGRAMRRIVSSHVVAVHDLGETDRQQPYLVMQHADRGTLAQRVASRRGEGWTPSHDDVRAVAAALAEAITAVHQARIVHRDLSPRNILLRSLPTPADTSGEPATGQPPLIASDEQLLLADLGLCKDLARHSGLTAAGGTDGFRPPEQRTGAGYVSPAADLWSLSALVTWLITGRSPSDDEDVTPAVEAAGFPAALGQVLNTGLATDPAARAPDATCWLADINAALTPPAVEEAAPDPAPPGAAGEDAASGASGASRGVWPPRPRHLLTAALAVVVLVVAAVLLTGDGLERTDLAEDNVVLERRSGDATLTLAGPTEVGVGDRAAFIAQHDGMVSTVWFAPDGAMLADQPALTFTALSPGIARVHLMGVTAEGELLRIDHDVRVRTADD